MTLQRMDLQMGGESHYPALFEPTVPNSPALWAVLEGRNSGRVVVDDAQRPSLCVLRTDAILTFASRRMEPSFLADAIAQFRQTGPVWLVWPTDWSSRMSVPDANNVIQRVEFLGCDPGAPALDDLRRRLPEDCEIRPIDRHLLDRCEWRSEMEFYCGSLENFLVNGIGLCLMRGGEIIVEAYVSSYGQGKAEIGAVTREAYRGRGYAPITCAFLIEVCHQRGLGAYWSCDADHQASIRVARKLGFREEKGYQILEYEGCDPLLRPPGVDRA
jgi:RimJ/RimL family protein N-acetyltransferase